MRILVEICNLLWLYLAGVSDYASMGMLLFRALEASWCSLLGTYKESFESFNFFPITSAGMGLGLNDHALGDNPPLEECTLFSVWPWDLPGLCAW